MNIGGSYVSANEPALGVSMTGPVGALPEEDVEMDGHGGEEGDEEQEDDEEDEEIDESEVEAIRVGRCSGLSTAPDTSFRTISVPH